MTVKHRAKIVTVMMKVRAAMPPIVIPASINSCGGMRVRSRPMSACHWISQLVPTNEMIATNRATSPPVKRSMRTACNEGACEGEGLSASVLPTMCCAINLSFFCACVSGTFFISTNVDCLPHLNALGRTPEELKRTQLFRFFLRTVQFAHRVVVLSPAYMLFLKFL